MIISLSIQAFCHVKAQEQISFSDNEGLAETQIQEDFEFELATLLNKFHDARAYCTECFGTDDNHYLGCSVWQALPFRPVPQIKVTNEHKD